MKRNCLLKFNIKQNIVKRTKTISEIVLAMTVGGLLVKKIWKEKYYLQRKEKEKLEQERDLLRAWLKSEREAGTFATAFSGKGYHRIAILGMNWEGRFLADVLGDVVAYGVEAENFGAVHPRFVVYRLGEDSLPPADCLVICDLNCLPEKVMCVKKEFSGEIFTIFQLLQL